jgi:uncharacterized protein YqfB (UPF0267 family)
VATCSQDIENSDEHFREKYQDRIGEPKFNMSFCNKKIDDIFKVSLSKLKEKGKLQENFINLLKSRCLQQI